jgi:predicted phage tail protein
VQGLELPIFGEDGTFSGEQFTNNPAWILLDILRSTGWADSEIDFQSFAQAAAYCDEEIPARDIYGGAIALRRFGCNLILQNRRSAGDIVRGVRNAARLLMTYGANGLLKVRVENTIALENPTKAEWSNSAAQLDGGWPSYEFGDGSNGHSGILRRPNGEPSVRLFSRSMADTPNRLTVEFQDALNEFQHDSFSLVNSEDVRRSGQEVSSAMSAIGIPNFDQAGRILKLRLDKSIEGNTYIEFETSVKCFGIRPGDLVSLTYLKEGFVRQPFRVLKLAPGPNHRVTVITAQLHSDNCYEDVNGQPN